MDETRAAAIRRLNDKFRTTGEGGRLLMTSGIQALGDITATRILAAVRTFSEFSADNDPYQEHDFGAFKVEGREVFWKIDTYAPDLVHGSEDPANPHQTVRVLTIMLAEEY